MQNVLGTSAAVDFQLDLGVKLGVFYCYAFLGNSLQEDLGSALDRLLPKCNLHNGVVQDW